MTQTKGFAHVTLRTGARFFLRIVSVSPKLVTGYEVDRDGEEIRPDGFERRLRVIALSVILRCRENSMDRTYATLRPKGERKLRATETDELLTSSPEQESRP